MSKEIKKGVKKWDVVMVYWLDSVSDTSWKKESEYLNDDGGIEHESCGFYLGESDRTIKLIQNKSTRKDKNGELLVDNYMQIPKVSITKIIKVSKN